VLGLIDELIWRRADFRAGREITLANHQPWTFPSPHKRPGLASRDPADEYFGLLRAVREAEDLHERRLAELVLAIYLIELNYQLSPSQLEFLFTFRAGSPELADAQDAFSALAGEHLQLLYPEAILPLPSSVDRPSPGFRARFRGWLRGLRAFRRWISPSRNGEAIP
jgi:hypothetical protein